MRSSVKRAGFAAAGVVLAATLATAANIAWAAGPSGSLTIHNGNLYVDQVGAHIHHLEVRGRVIVRANNVTISNLRVVGTGTTQDTLIDVGRGTSGVVIEDTTVRPSNPGENAQGVRGWGFTLDRVDISNVVDGVMIAGPNATIRNSVIHDLHIQSSTFHADGKTHSDSIQVEGGSNIVIENNTLSGANVAAVMITQNAGKVRNLSIHANSLRGGSCAINADEKGKGAFIGLLITSNTFGPAGNGTTTPTVCPMRLPTTSKASTILVGNTLTTKAAASPWWY